MPERLVVALQDRQNRAIGAQENARDKFSRISMRIGLKRHVS